MRLQRAWWLTAPGMLAVVIGGALLAWGSRRGAARSVPAAVTAAVAGTVPAPCGPGARATHLLSSISVACSRQGQGYPISVGTEYIAAHPAIVAPGQLLTVWGNCGCGELPQNAQLPVETVQLWLVRTERRAMIWHGQRLVVNAGRALLGTARIDRHSYWRASVYVPAYLGAGFGLSAIIPAIAGRYAVMVTYPGEEAGPEYYAPAAHEGSITGITIARLREKMRQPS